MSNFEQSVVICATCMSLGLSGISLNLNSKISLVPYLVAFISLENILVITQSVILTPTHLDVKIRIAQGLSREGTFIHFTNDYLNLDEFHLKRCKMLF